MTERRWIGVDFDGTLAIWGCAWVEDYHATGAPIPRTVSYTHLTLPTNREV